MRLRVLMGRQLVEVLLRLRRPSARGGRGRARTRGRRGQSRGSRSSGRSGSMNGNRRHACTIAICVANVASGAARPRLREVLDERLVVLAQRGQVPRLVEHLLRLAQRAQLGPEGQQLRRLLGLDQRLAIHVRRDPQPVPERAEPRPRELRRQLMAQLAPLLGHPQHQQQPAPVPAHRPAEPVDPPRAVAQQRGRGRRQPHPRPPARPARPPATPRACCAPRPAAPRCGVNPSRLSAAISASCQAPSGRGSRNSPRIVSSVERAAGAPTERRRRTSSTAETLSRVVILAPMKHRALDEVYCSVARTWSVLGDRWTMLILREAFAGTSRFDGSRRKLEIGRTLLAERLNRLVEEGIFERVQLQRAAGALRVQAHAQGAGPVPGAAGADGVGGPLQGRGPAGAAVPQGVRRGGRPAPGVQPLRRAGRVRRPARRVRARTHGDVSSAARSPTSTRAPGSRPTSRSRTGGSSTSGRASRDRRASSTCRGKVVVARLHRAAHAPVVPVLAELAARGRGPRRDDDARLRQPVLLPRARRRRAARDRRPDERGARPHQVGGADRGRRRRSPSDAFDPERRRADARSGRRSSRRGEITNWFGVDPRRASRAGSPPRRPRASASRATTPAPPTTASTSSPPPASPPTTRRSRPTRRATGCGSGMWTMLRQSSLRPDLEPMLRDLTPIVGSARRLMFTTDGAVPSFYAARGMIGGCLRIASDLGIDPMRALQMATIDPATFLRLDEELGGVAPGRHATLNILPAPGEWRPELVLVKGEIVARDGALRRGPARDRLAARAARSTAPRDVHAAHRQPAGGALRERGDQPPRRPRGAADRPPGRARRPRRDVDHAGRDRELPRHARASPPPRRRRLELLVLGTDPAAMARAARQGRRDGRRLRLRRRLVGAAGDRRPDRARRLRARARDRARADACRCSARATRSTIRCTPCCSPPATSCRRSG